MTYGTQKLQASSTRTSLYKKRFISNLCQSSDEDVQDFFKRVATCAMLSFKESIIDLKKEFAGAHIAYIDKATKLMCVPRFAKSSPIFRLVKMWSRFFDLLYLNWMEFQNHWVEKEKWAVLAESCKIWPRVNFSITIGQNIKIRLCQANLFWCTYKSLCAFKMVEIIGDSAQLGWLATCHIQQST